MGLCACIARLLTGVKVVMRILLFVLLGLLVCGIASAKKKSAKKHGHKKSGGIAADKNEGAKTPKGGKKAIGKEKAKGQQFIPPPPPPPPVPPPGVVPTPGPPPPAPPPYYPPV